MAIELRLWPGEAGDFLQLGAQDEADDLVVHYALDCQPWLWEIEHASTHPDYIAAALKAYPR